MRCVRRWPGWAWNRRARVGASRRLLRGASWRCPRARPIWAPRRWCRPRGRWGASRPSRWPPTRRASPTCCPAGAARRGRSRWVGGSAGGGGGGRGGLAARGGGARRNADDALEPAREERAGERHGLRLGRFHLLEQPRGRVRTVARLQLGHVGRDPHPFVRQPARDLEMELQRIGAAEHEGLLLVEARAG